MYTTGDIVSRIGTAPKPGSMRAMLNNVSENLSLLLCLTLAAAIGGTMNHGTAQVSGSPKPAGSKQMSVDAQTPWTAKRVGSAKTPGGGMMSGSPKTSGSAKTAGSAKAPGTAQTSTSRAGAASSMQNQFEGIIQSRNRSVDYGGETQEYEMTIWVKKAQVKVTVPQIGATPGSTVIYRTDSRVSWILNDQDQTYFEVALAPRQGMQQPTHSEHAAPEKPAVTRTNKTRKILGYMCEQVMILKGETETEIWGTKGLGDLTQMLNQSLQAESAGGEEGDLIAKMGLYPLESVTRYEGRILESQEVTKIERKSLSNDLFQIPAGYKKQKALDVE